MKIEINDKLWNAYLNFAIDDNMRNKIQIEARQRIYGFMYDEIEKGMIRQRDKLIKEIRQDSFDRHYKILDELDAD